MLSEAISKIQELVTAGNDVQILKVPGESPATLRLVRADGTIEVSQKTPPHRFIEVGGLTDLMRLAQTPLDPAWAKRAIFFSMTEVVLVLDYTTGYEIAKLPLTSSSEMNWFNERVTSPVQEVPHLVLALQTVLRNTREPADMEAFIAAVGKLTIQGGTNQSAEASRVGAGISKSIMQSVAQPDLMPAELQEFRVRPFSVPDIPFRTGLMCSLLPQVAKCVWLLQPVPESLLMFKHDVLQHLRERLEGAVKEVPVFCGRFDTTATK